MVGVGEGRDVLTSNIAQKPEVFQPVFSYHVVFCFFNKIYLFNTLKFELQTELKTNTYLSFDMPSYLHLLYKTEKRLTYRIEVCNVLLLIFTQYCS